MLNSRLGLFSAAHLRAPLLPKLRGQLAEFLNNPSPVGLRIFFLSTCVGLRYGLLPVSVCGTGSIFYTHSFSRLLPSLLPAHSQSLTTEATNARLNPSKVSLCLNGWRLRNFYRMCIGYAFRPYLSSRLTRSGRTFLLKP